MTHSRWGSTLRALLCIALILVAAGCTTKQYQRHYFAVADIDSVNPELKFYRVTVDAKARNSNVHIHTGMHDANAVRQLYGALPDPASDTAEGVAGVGPRQFARNPATGSWDIIDDQVFTIIYGTDASAIAGQIDAFKTSLTTGNAMGRLMGAAFAGDLYEEVTNAEADKALRAEQDKALGDALQALSAGLDSSIADAKVAREQLEKAMREVVKSLVQKGAVTVPQSVDTMNGEQMRELLYTFIGNVK